MGVVLGGMLIRMVLLLAIVGLVLAFLAVQPIAFALPLTLTLVVGLGLEAWWMMRRLRETSGAPDETT